MSDLFGSADDLKEASETISRYAIDHPEDVAGYALRSILHFAIYCDRPTWESYRGVIQKFAQDGIAAGVLRVSDPTEMGTGEISHAIQQLREDTVNACAVGRPANEEKDLIEALNLWADEIADDRDGDLNRFDLLRRVVDLLSSPVSPKNLDPEPWTATDGRLRHSSAIHGKGGYCIFAPRPEYEQLRDRYETEQEQ